jgi:hypothetical protein
VSPERRGVIDRLEEDQAVILVGDDEVEHHLPVAELPAEAAEGSVVLLEVDGERLTVLGVEAIETEQRRADMAERLARLRRERSTGRFRHRDR